MKKHVLSATLVLGALTGLISACSGEGDAGSETQQVACRTYLVTVAGADTTLAKSLVEALGTDEIPAAGDQVTKVQDAAKAAALVPRLPDADFKAFTAVAEALTALFPSEESISLTWDDDVRAYDRDVKALRERCKA